MGKTYTLETYIQMDAESEEKYEYFDGLILAMAGGDPDHGLIGINIGTALNRNRLTSTRYSSKNRRYLLRCGI